MLKRGVLFHFAISVDTFFLDSVESIPDISKKILETVQNRYLLYIFVTSITRYTRYFEVVIYFHSVCLAGTMSLKALYNLALI